MNAQEDRKHQRHLHPDNRKAFHGLIDDQVRWIHADFGQRIHRRSADEIPQLIAEDHAYQESHAEAVQRPDDASAQFL
jgi:hypothetical protein